MIFFFPVDPRAGISSGRDGQCCGGEGKEEKQGQKEWMQDDGQTRGAASVQLQLDRHGR